jgi:2-succinyl-5-enolpyruvyl-6-hydroxy-3-cyclohexene-1-carboxylate synthase
MVDELIRCGVCDVIVAPGSRSAPLAIAFAEAEARGEIVLHVRLDERTAGFLALGLGKVSGIPAVVLTTSGTAAVNLHPAIIEAVFERQKAILNDKKLTEKEREEKARFFILLDDVISVVPA